MRKQRGYLPPNVNPNDSVIEHYHKALDSDTLLDSEYWYQGVFHGGNYSDIKSTINGSRCRSQADNITNEVFQKYVRNKSYSRPLERINTVNPDSDGQDILIGTQEINNNTLTPGESVINSFTETSKEEVINILFLFRQISTTLESCHLKVLAYYLTRSKTHLCVPRDLMEDTVPELWSHIEHFSSLPSLGISFLYRYVGTRFKTETRRNQLREFLREELGFKLDILLGED